MPECLGEVWCHYPHSSLPLLLEDLLAQREARQLPLDSGEQEKVSRGKIHHIRRVLDHLYLHCYHPLGHYGSGVQKDIVPVKPPLSCCHYQPLLLQNLHEPANEGLYDVLVVTVVLLGTWLV